MQGVNRRHGMVIPLMVRVGDLHLILDDELSEENLTTMPEYSLDKEDAVNLYFIERPSELMENQRRRFAC